MFLRCCFPSMAMNTAKMPKSPLHSSGNTMQNNQSLQMNASSPIKDNAKLNYNA